MVRVDIATHSKTAASAAAAAAATATARAAPAARLSSAAAPALTPAQSCCLAGPSQPGILPRGASPQGELEKKRRLRGKAPRACGGGGASARSAEGCSESVSPRRLREAAVRPRVGS